MATSTYIYQHSEYKTDLLNHDLLYRDLLDPDLTNQPTLRYTASAA